MSVVLIVDNIPYEYPVDGQEPGTWGQPASDWAIAVTGVLNSLLGADDILQTTFTIANNVSSFANITGLAFNTGTVRSALIQYAIYRVSTASPSGHAESGTIDIVYDNAASAGNKWAMTVRNNGNSGVTFNITDAGQLQYKSTDITSPAYSGVIKFSAKTLGQ